MSGFLLDVYVRSLILGALFLCAIAVLRGRSASVRHSIAVVAIAILLVLPILRLTVPGKTLAWLPAPARPNTPRTANAIIPPALVLGVSKPVKQGPPEPHADWIALLALVGPALFAARYLHGVATLRRWTLAGRRVNEPASPVEVVASSKVSAPMTAFIGRHVILVPSSWNSWTEGRRQAVLRHELAHVRRTDCLWQGLAYLTCALYWPNPFVWLIAREARTLSEQAADDMVLASGADRHRYAQDLLDIARETRATFPAPAITMANESDVARRIKMVLNTNVRRGAATVSSLLISIALMGLVAVPLAATKLTRQQPAVVPPPKASASREKAQVVISCTILKPGQTVEAIAGKFHAKPVASNDNELTATVKPPATAASRTPDIFQLENASVPEFVKVWKGAGIVLSTPRIFTTIGQNASITTTYGPSGTKYDTLTLTPSARSKVTLEMEASIDQHDGAKRSYHGWNFLFSQPGAFLLLRPDATGKKMEVFALLQIKTIGDDRITP